MCSLCEALVVLDTPPIYTTFWLSSFECVANVALKCGLIGCLQMIMQYDFVAFFGCYKVKTICGSLQ